MDELMFNQALYETRTMLEREQMLYAAIRITKIVAVATVAALVVKHLTEKHENNSK